ncbi:hypothetical protein CMV_027510, partial [Castanea mollissima]
VYHFSFHRLHLSNLIELTSARILLPQRGDFAQNQNPLGWDSWEVVCVNILSTDGVEFLEG